MGIPYLGKMVFIDRPRKVMWLNSLSALCPLMTTEGTEIMTSPLQWRRNDHNDVWTHQPHGCLLNRLFRRRSKKTSKLRVTGLCVGNSPGPVNSPHKGPVTRKMFPFDDVIMQSWICIGLPLKGLRYTSGLSLGLCPANEIWCYFVTMSLTAWAQA